MSEMLLWLWPLSGIVIVWWHTPYWMRVSSPVEFALMNVLAAFSGPALLIAAMLDRRDTELDAKYDARARAKRAKSPSDKRGSI